VATNEVSIAAGDCWRLDNGDDGSDGDTDVASIIEVTIATSYTVANKSFAAASPLTSDGDVSSTEV
jgi:hypothetical protein